MARSLSLDVLRGVAILLVIGAHIDHIPAPSGPFGALAHGWVIAGWLGVDLFFVLSGFLIGGLLLTEYANHGTIRPWQFLARRGFKIYPLYLLFLAYLIAMPTAKALVGNGDALTTAGAQVEAYWPNALFLHTYIGDNPAGHTWSLAVEEHFYLTLPFLLLLLAKRQAMAWLLPLCFVVVPILALGARIVSTLSGADYPDTMSDTQSRIDALLFGVGLKAVALWHPQTFAAIGRHRWALVAFGLACWSPVWLVDVSRPFWFRTAGFALTFVGAGAFLIAAVHTHARELPRVGIRLAQAIGWIGFYSYGIYLWHITVMGITDRLIGAPIAANLTTTNAWLLRVTVIVGSVCLVGVVLSTLIEIPALRLRDRLYPSRAHLRKTAVAA